MLPKLTICLAALAAAVPAAALKPAGAAVTAPEQAALDQALNRGKLLHAYDRAAWVGSDDLVAKLPGFAEKVGGWIVDGPAAAPELIFFDKDPKNPRAVYRARFGRGKLVESRILGEAEDRTLSPRSKALVAALRTASDSLVRSKAKTCKKQSFNTVVLPPASAGEPTLVYFLTPQTDADAIPMGGHYLVEVSADGRAAAPRPFTNSCLELRLQEDKKKGTPAGLMVSHLLDPSPTEIHVFSSLSAGLPVFVGTSMNKRVWAVEGGRIRLLKAD